MPNPHPHPHPRPHPTAQTGGSGKVTVETKLDPSLIAGMTITFGDKYIDMSVASQVFSTRTRTRTRPRNP